jgi:hypothetical protein
MGMMNVVVLPLGLILLLAGLRKIHPGLYRYGLVAWLALYAFGVLGFLYGLSAPELYGLHIQLSEAAYKLAAPLLLVLLALPLCIAPPQARLA